MGREENEWENLVNDLFNNDVKYLEILPDSKNQTARSIFGNAVPVIDPKNGIKNMLVYKA